MLESEKFMYHKYMEDHYPMMVKEYETELMEDHLKMTFERLPLSDEVKHIIIGMFIEYLINLSVIKTYKTAYKGSKLTMEQLNYLENLIGRSIFMIFQMANKDKVNNGNLAYQMKSLYDSLKLNSQYLKFDFIDVGFDEDGFFYYEIT